MVVQRGSPKLELGFGNLVLDKHKHVTIFHCFRETCFSVGHILVDGQERLAMGIHGYYKLDQVTSTHYTIKVEKEQFKFSSLEKFMFIPDMASTPKINATHSWYSIKLLTSDYGGKHQFSLTRGLENVKGCLLANSTFKNFNST